MAINTHKEFDQIFREKLQNNEVMPPESVWAGIEASGLAGTATTTSNWRWWAAASVLVLFISASAYIYFNNGESASNINLQNNPSQQLINSSNQQTQLEPNELNPSAIVEEKSIVGSIEPILVNTSTNQILETSEDLAVIEKMVFEENVLEVEDEKDLQIEAQAEEVVKPVRLETPQKMSQTGEEFSIEENITVQSILKQEDSKHASRAGRDFFDDDAIDDITLGHRNEKYWVLGIEFSPEWVTIPDNSNNIKSYGLDFSARYQLSKLFFETGLGLAFSKDNGDYDVDYQEALFKGSYEDVYDVTFEIVNGQEVPTYFTKTVNVYDTIDRVSISENENKYAYLNIPINFGYYTKLGDKFSFYAKAGINTSFKIYQDIPVPVISGENVTVIKVTPRYYNRTDWHMQAQLNVGLNYHVTDQFLFGLEPNIRYYVKSLVENNPSGNPYGLGVKIGFKYILK